METELLYKYLKGRTTSGEEARIAEWLSSDPENQKELDYVRFMFDSAELYGGDLRSARKPSLVSWRKLGRYAVQLAAAVMIAVGAGLLAKRHSSTGCPICGTPSMCRPDSAWS